MHTIEVLLFIIFLLLVILAGACYWIGHHSALIVDQVEHHEAEVNTLINRALAAERMYVASLETGADRVLKAVGLQRATPPVVATPATPAPEAAASPAVQA